MYYRIIRNDFKKSKLISITTMIFVACAALLVSLAAMLIINLSGAIDTLMTQAKTPHFMQMHSGEIDKERLEAFAKDNTSVDQYQVIDFLNIEGDRITVNGQSLADSVQDNGLCTQSNQFDYLLDLNNKVIKVSEGQIYLPVYFLKDRLAKVGNQVLICGKQFTVAGFLRDSQMNSLLASSKRFLVNEKDYNQLKAYGKVEYLIEFRLKNLSKLGAFETAYTSAGLEANGPTITYPLFKTINAISDGLMIAVILLVSVLVVAIAFMCIRFTLLAKIEEDYQEIGVLKAIGLRVSDIKKIYLSKYTVIAATGCILGYLLSFVFRNFLLENIRLYMGNSNNTITSLLFGTVGVLFVFLIIILYVNRVLKRFRKISAAEAVRFGVSQEKSKGSKHFNLSKNRLYHTNVFLGIKDVLTRTKLYFVMLLILIISIFIVLVPQNIYHTISSKQFVSFMGVGACDMRIDLQQMEHISEKSQNIAKEMKQDSQISRYAVFTTKTFDAYTNQGTKERIKIELGDHSVFPLTYTQGNAPLKEDEIALSVMNSDELGKKVGDTIKIMIDGKEKELKVCGIYSDITNGGKTAKAAFKDNSADIMWCVICASFQDQSLTDKKVSDYNSKFNYAKISDTKEFMKQTLGPTIRSVQNAYFASCVIAIVITLLITLLFMKMLVAKDKYPIAVMKAFGFTNADIKIQFVTRSICVLIIGIIMGTLLANTLGEKLVGLVISSIGAASFHFEVNALSAYLLCPFMIAVTVIIATLIGITRMEQIKLSENIKE
jgi:ABC-type transport system, involved in lipoprotein release, permease component